MWSLFSGISYGKAPGHKAFIGMVSIALEAAGISKMKSVAYNVTDIVAMFVDLFLIKKSSHDFPFPVPI